SVNPRSDLAAAFGNGSRIGYVFQTYGLQNLTNNSDKAAAVQLAIWDLLLPHNPTFFAPNGDGTYSSGDPSVFNVDLGSNPDASQIAALTDQYLKASIGATTSGAWFDASPSGTDPNRGENLLQPVPEPSSIVTSIVSITCLGVWSLWRRSACAHKRSSHGGPLDAAPGPVACRPDWGRQPATAPRP